MIFCAAGLRMCVTCILEALAALFAVTSIFQIVPCANTNSAAFADNNLHLYHVTTPSGNCTSTRRDELYPAVDESFKEIKAENCRASQFEM